MKRIIAVECWSDKYFFSKLLSNDALIRKEKHKSAVIQSLVNRSKGKFSIGIVDDDNENIEKYLKGIVIEGKIKLCKELELVKLANENHFILQLSPRRFEKWVVEFLSFQNLSLGSFGYNSIKEFDDESKVVEEKILRNQKLLNVFNYVLSNYQNSDNHILKAKKTIEYLVKNSNQINLNELKNV